MKIGDWTGSQWVSMFSSEAERVLGITAEEAAQKVQYELDCLSEIVNNAEFKQFVMKYRVKWKTYNARQAVNYSINYLYFTTHDEVRLP